ncbi:methyltransferase domain-containing protein [Conexibacter woesei]|uniref:Methyltransferase type 12 n=1 Tax=Conexibacter woesei (strain DSM 14684 / CCUG 47730 / CIP 108061 / JCM 11494 / NBRC 100937 / ID131577) TaxID=469383 RepID=D3EZQ1_CONWI|nr:methyltransferase domain-containing protein [Conexibacter woesei]ADB53889.1 hypothetical protein Cwoe_5484 [Conexibacter woesei DSM 14684]
MPDWQERINDDTRPAIRAEHELRYAVAAPLIRASARWCDLGCGTGLGAVTALAGEELDGTALLVDRDATAAERAATAVPARATTAIGADLSTAAGIDRVRAALADASGAGALCVTAFELIEHLESFAPLVALLVELGARPDATVLLSVPNDAFWAIDNPHHRTTWGEGAVEELRSLLPAGHVALHQLALEGSALLPLDEATVARTDVALAPGVPSHVLLAFGAQASQVTSAVTVVQSDLEAQRRWERQRESDLLYYVKKVEALEQQLAERASTDAAPADGDVDAPAASGHA